MLDYFEVTALILAVTALSAWMNAAWFGLPNQIALVLSGLAISLVLLGLDKAVPHMEISTHIDLLLGSIDFSQTLLQGMLGYLLFAGALHVDLSRLQSRKWIVVALATAGVAISTVLVGTGFWLASIWVGMDIPFMWSLVFGALISPTDPVAVLSTIRKLGLPEEVEMDISGEALFNDGVAIVLFTILLAAASAHHGVSAGEVARLFIVEAGGGIVLGVATGYLIYRLMRRIDEYPVEVLLSLALATATYAIALRIHVSGPLAVVAAGVLIGNRGAACAMSERTRRYLFGFWDLVEESLNSILFLLIGIEVLLVEFRVELLTLAAVTVPIVVLSRLAAVSLPVSVLAKHGHFSRGTIPILTWAGVRGGISVALALSLPQSSPRASILAATYTVALFTIIIQGGTLGTLVRRLKTSNSEAVVGPGLGEGLNGM